jgi:hypothetical protein
LRIALRHVTTEAVLAELRRNSGLRRLIGIESEGGVPKPWNISRFEEVLGQEPHRTSLKEVFEVLIRRLGAVVPDLGKDTAGDATGRPSRAVGAKKSRLGRLRNWWTRTRKLPGVYPNRAAA